MKHRKRAAGAAPVASFPENALNPPVYHGVCPRKRATVIAVGGAGNGLSDAQDPAAMRTWTRRDPVTRPSGHGAGRRHTTSRKGCRGIATGRRTTCGPTSPCTNRNAPSPVMRAMDPAAQADGTPTRPARVATRWTGEPFGGPPLSGRKVGPRTKTSVSACALGSSSGTCMGSRIRPTKHQSKRL